jgi:uncharacterized protein
MRAKFAFVVLCLLTSRVCAQTTCHALQQTANPKHELKLVKDAASGDVHAQLMLGRNYECTQHYAEAAQWYRLAADHGSAAAETNLGSLFADGLGVQHDDSEAFKLYLRAASSGFGPAENNVAIMYYNGRGTPKSEEAAATWFTRAVGHRYYPAYAALAKQYLDGRGVPADSNEAYRLFLQAAEHGVVSAQENLALMFSHGIGIQRDTAKAVDWSLKAIAAGSVLAENNLGYLYEQGDDRMPPDLEQAAIWYRRAAEHGLAQGAYNLALLYRDGRGVEQNRDESNRLFAQAASHGFTGLTHADRTIASAKNANQK